MWLNDKLKRSQTRSNGCSDSRASAVTTPKQLPVTMDEDVDRTVRYRYGRTKKGFVKVDENAETHTSPGTLLGQRRYISDSRTFADDIPIAPVQVSIASGTTQLTYLLGGSLEMLTLHLYTWFHLTTHPSRDDITVVVVFFVDDMS